MPCVALGRQLRTARAGPVAWPAKSYRRAMSLRPVLHTAPSVRTPPGYSHAVQAAGLIFVSGQVALDTNGSVVGLGDMGEQARQAFRNLGAVLEATGCSFADVVKLTYFVRDVDTVGQVRAARDEFIDTANPPASTLVEVSRLFMPDLLIEIEAVALAPQAAR